jgi:tetratricopeptide (TPR) repeat protein
MRKVLFSSFLLLVSFPTLIFAQRDSLRTTFLDAESWFLFEEYSDALPLYESLLELDPDNDHLKYKIGICLLNDPYQKDKAIQYLLEACNNINPSYKEGSIKERTAPPDALYYLGDAYLVNELLDRAIESYEKFLDIMDPEVYDKELVLAQIRSCKNAKRLKTMPVDIDLTLLDSLINSRYADINPVVSGDGTKMAYVTKLPFYDGAFYTEKTKDGWSYPQLITQMMGFDANIYPVALSYDGTEMILYYDDDYIGNLFYSRMEDGLWTPATKMDENISTKYWESNASFSKDGNTLYFTSNRKGTNGGLDIYRSELQSDGKWGVPVNLGPTINTPYNEDCPRISEDGQTLYFSSYGHYNMGGYDIFYSRKNKDGNWAEPINIGYPINTTDDDLFFQPVNNGHSAYYSIYNPMGFGRHDIYYMNIYSVNNPRFYSVTGHLRTDAGSIDSTRMAIYVIDASSGDTLLYTSPSKSGDFAFHLKQGIYELHFKGEGYGELIRPLQINAGSNKQGFTLEEPIELQWLDKKPELFEGEESKVKLKESEYKGIAGIPVLVPVTAPRGKRVVIRTYQDSVLVSTDTLLMHKRKTDMQIIPLQGTSELELEMIDEEGNMHRNRITVVGDVQVQLPSQRKKGQDKVENEQVEAEKASNPVDSVYEDPMRFIMAQLKSKSGGALYNELMTLDSMDSGFKNEEALFEQLYEHADAQGYSKNEVDALLLDEIADGHRSVAEQGDARAQLLRQLLMEQAEGPLKEYLQQLDLETEGIHSDRALLGYLEEKAEAEDFTMDDLRKAMIRSLNQPLEVDRVHSGIFGDQDAGSIAPDRKSGWPLIVVLAVLGAGLIWLVIAWWRRREEKVEKGK